MANLLFLAPLFADARTNGGGGGGLLVTVLTIVGLWTVFTKAGQPGWAAIIPVYNLYILFKIAGKPAWWLLLLLVPVLNLIIGFIVTSAVAAKFGKGLLYTLGMIFLPFIFFPILGLGSSTYSANR